MYTYRRFRWIALEFIYYLNLNKTILNTEKLNFLLLLMEKGIYGLKPFKMLMSHFRKMSEKNMCPITNLHYVETKFKIIKNGGAESYVAHNKGCLYAKISMDHSKNFGKKFERFVLHQEFYYHVF